MSILPAVTITRKVLESKNAAQREYELIREQQEQTFDLADPDDPYAQAELSSAASCGDVRTVRRLVVEGINVNFGHGTTFETALMFASWNGQLNVVQYLVENTYCEIDLTTTSGTTALMLAASHSKYSVCDFLCQVGADVSLIDNDGNSAAQFAAESASHDILDLLIRYGASAVDMTGKPLTDVERDDDAAEPYGGLFAGDWLYKKNTSGVKGFHAWRKRWCHLVYESLYYYKNRSDTKEKGIIDLDQIVEVHWLGEAKERGTRFSLIMESGRIYDFRAGTRRTAVTWVGQLQDLLQSFGRDVKGANTEVYEEVRLSNSDYEGDDARDAAMSTTQYTLAQYLGMEEGLSSPKASAKKTPDKPVASNGSSAKSVASNGSSAKPKKKSFARPYSSPASPPTSPKPRKSALLVTPSVMAASYRGGGASILEQTHTLRGERVFVRPHPDRLDEPPVMIDDVDSDSPEVDSPPTSTVGSEAKSRPRRHRKKKSGLVPVPPSAPKPRAKGKPQPSSSRKSTHFNFRNKNDGEDGDEEEQPASHLQQSWRPSNLRGGKPGEDGRPYVRKSMRRVYDDNMPYVSAKNRYLMGQKNLQDKQKAREMNIKSSRVTTEVQAIDSKGWVKSSRVIKERLQTQQTMSLSFKMKEAAEGRSSDGEKGDPTLLNLNNNGELQRMNAKEVASFVKQLEETLAKNPLIESLSMTNCGLTSEFVIELCKMLKANTTLRSVNLCTNKIRGPGFCELAEVLLANGHLHVLKLHNQLFTPSLDARKVLLDALEKNKTLLSLGYDFVVRTQNEKMHKYLDRNMELRRKTRVATSTGGPASNVNGQRSPPSGDSDRVKTEVAGVGGRGHTRTISQSYAEVIGVEESAPPYLLASPRATEAEGDADAEVSDPAGFDDSSDEEEEEADEYGDAAGSSEGDQPNPSDGSKARDRPPTTSSPSNGNSGDTAHRNSRTRRARSEVRQILRPARARVHRINTLSNASDLSGGESASELNANSPVFEGRSRSSSSATSRSRSQSSARTRSDGMSVSILPGDTKLKTYGDSPQRKPRSESWESTADGKTSDGDAKASATANSGGARHSRNSSVGDRLKAWETRVSSEVVVTQLSDSETRSPRIPPRPAKLSSAGSHRRQSDVAASSQRQRNTSIATIASRILSPVGTGNKDSSRSPSRSPSPRGTANAHRSTSPVQHLRTSRHQSSSLRSVNTMAPGGASSGSPGQQQRTSVSKRGVQRASTSLPQSAASSSPRKSSSRRRPARVVTEMKRSETSSQSSMKKLPSASRSPASPSYSRGRRNGRPTPLSPKGGAAAMKASSPKGGAAAATASSPKGVAAATASSPKGAAAATKVSSPKGGTAATKASSPKGSAAARTASSGDEPHTISSVPIEENVIVPKALPNSPHEARALVKEGTKTNFSKSPTGVIRVNFCVHCGRKLQLAVSQKFCMECGCPVHEIDAV